MNANQLTLALLSPVSKSGPFIDGVSWLDVTDLAKGVGFETRTAISIALADALASRSGETESAYDQHLYDALWLAQFQFTLNSLHPTTFNFSFLCMHARNPGFDEVSLCLHVESVDQTTFLGLLEDF